jgi:hypothetical protein
VVELVGPIGPEKSRHILLGVPVLRVQIDWKYKYFSRPLSDGILCRCSSYFFIMMHIKWIYIAYNWLERGLYNQENNL